MDPLTHWEGEPVSVREAVWGIPRLEAWAQLPSTNDRGRRLALDGAPAWTVVVAGRQTAGRGRAGRPWQSDDGAGLWASVILRPRSPAQGGLLPLLTGVALARALEADPSAPGPGVGLKWPNDVWIAGRKVAGVLCEAAAAAVVVGVGVNLRTPPGGFAPGHAARSGSLEALSGRPWSGARVLGALIRELRPLLDPPRLRFDGPLARAWGERDILLGRPVRVGPVQGIARGVDPDGSLRVERPDGTLTPVRAGRVEWTPPDGPAPGAAASNDGTEE